MIDGVRVPGNTPLLVCGTLLLPPEWPTGGALLRPRKSVAWLSPLASLWFLSSLRVTTYPAHCPVKITVDDSGREMPHLHLRLPKLRKVGSLS